ncbi:protein of unknown function [Ruminococcaceae bacterium BL-6]|nr:protein of unknown function [Ruminococcaceae bacterium BL-6]
MSENFPKVVLTNSLLNVILITVKGGGIIKTVTLRLSDELHKQMKLLTVKKDVSIQDYITRLIKLDLQNEVSDNQQK